MRSLEVHLNERLVGTLNEGQDLWSFRYDPTWRQAPDGFDLSPALARTQVLHEDGGSHRPVQWYFDNLLPEESLREAVSKEARIQGDDAFALLQYLGAESAGSLVLTPPGVSGQRPVSGGELRPLSDEALSQRIRALPRSTLGSGAPKRMSAAGAQHKLLVVLRQGQLFEPVGSEPHPHPQARPSGTGLSTLRHQRILHDAARTGRAGRCAGRVSALCAGAGVSGPAFRP